MTRSNPDPNPFLDGLYRLADRMTDVHEGRRHDTRQPEQGTREGEDAWRRATAEAGRKLCAANGHRSYQVVQRDRQPVAVKCPTCGETWQVVAS